MTIVRTLAALLAFRAPALRTLAAKRAVILGCLYLASGFIVFVVIRNSVYATLREYPAGFEPPGLLEAMWKLNAIQMVLFLSLVYVPAVICLSNAIAGDGLGLTVSREEYQTQSSALLPLWGTIFLISAPLQLLLPQFLVIGFFGISLGLLTLIVSIAVYTIWAIRELNHISTVAAAAVFALSWATLPLFYVLSMFFFALPLFIIIPVLYIGYQRYHSFLEDRGDERSFHRYLQTLALNPQNADAQYQLGLICLKRGKLEEAQRHFEDACRIDPQVPDYHYYLGRACEASGDWACALGQYEETYRHDSQYGQGDIFREVGKGYLQTGRLEKAVEFLSFFLGIRGSDPEGRYWLAVALGRLGKEDEMRAQLHTILGQARSQPRFFRKEKREWVTRSRTLLHNWPASTSRP